MELGCHNVLWITELSVRDKERQCVCVCVGVRDGAGGALPHTAHHQKACVLVKCFSTTKHTYLKCMRGKTELCFQFSDVMLTAVAVFSVMIAACE